MNLGSITSNFGQSGSNSSLSSLPPQIASQIASAAVSGFHDTIIVISGVSFIGLLLALFLKNARDGAKETG
jgi:ABC-type dipeptide/oligopeptide/nickel transport system permease subunit